MLELLGGSLELELLGSSELDDFGAGLELLDETGGLLDDEGAMLDDERISTWFEKYRLVLVEYENELEELSVESGTLMISIVPEGSRSLCASATSLLQAATTMKMAANMYPLILFILIKL